jgi:hypothetical protein
MPIRIRSLTSHDTGEATLCVNAVTVAVANQGKTPPATRDQVTRFAAHGAVFRASECRARLLNFIEITTFPPPPNTMNNAFFV